MDDSEIQRIVEELDAAVTKDDAKLLICCEEEDTFCELIGNRKGYLRAGIEMLRAALTPLGPDDFITPIDLNYLIGQRGLFVKRLIRRDDVEEGLFPEKVTSMGAKAAGLGCFSVFILLAFCSIVGLFEVIGWFSKK